MDGTWGRLAGGMVALAAAMTLLTACDNSDAPSGRGAGIHACLPRGKAGPVVHEPPVVALEPDGHAGVPGTLAERVDLDLLEEHARSGSSRDEAEQFGLLFTQAVIDSREDVDAQRLVDAFMAQDVAEAACKHVVDRLPMMRELGWGSFIVPGTTAWVRSRAEGDVASPTRVEVQLVMAADLENDPHLFGVEDGDPMVFSVRVDVVRVDSVWLVADWQGPEAAGLDPGQRPTRKWYGVGWRPWEPKVR